MLLGLPGLDSGLLELSGQDSLLLGPPGLDSGLLGLPGLDYERLDPPGLGSEPLLDFRAPAASCSWGFHGWFLLVAMIFIFVLWF